MRDISSKRWTRVIWLAIILQQILFILLATVCKDVADYPPSELEPSEVTEEYIEQWLNAPTIFEFEHELKLFVGIFTVALTVVFVLYILAYITLWRTMSKREKTVLIIVLICHAVLRGIVILWFKQYTGVFYLYMRQITGEILSITCIALYFSRKLTHRSAQ